MGEVGPVGVLVQVIQAPVAGAVVQKLGVGAGAGDTAVFEIEDRVGVGDGQQVVGDDDHGAPGDQPA